MKLTTKTCDAAKPEEKSYRLSDGQGLYLEVRPTGAKYWRFKYRYAQKEKLLAFGVYPTVSLKQARDSRHSARELLSNHIDPSIEKKQKRIKQLSEAENTFRKLAQDWHQQWKNDKDEKHALTIMNRLEADVFPIIGNLSVNSIQPQMMLSVVKNVENRQAYDVAKRIRQTCGQIFRFGVANGRATRDITHDIRDCYTPYKVNHFPALQIKELPPFLKVLERNEMRLYKQTQMAMKLLMLTFVRTNELIKAQWDEFDLEEAQWVIPAQRMKMKKEHIVPLSKQALDIVKELQSMNGHRQWVFPNQQYPQKPMSNATITKAIQRMGYKDRMSGHGFRAMATTTIMEKFHYKYEVIDRQLAHSQNKIKAAYHRADYLDERKRMMQEYADYIDSIC